jgi:hypothetical protein
MNRPDAAPAVVPEGAQGREAGQLPYEKPAIIWEDDLGGRPGLIAACNKTAPLTTCDVDTLQS